MARPCIRVVLVSVKDRFWMESCERALRERGVESVKAYNCWSAELAQQLHEGEAIVMDSQVLCEFVSPERPGPVLGGAPKLPVVIFNAQEMDEEQRSAAMAHNALMLDGDDIGEITCSVERLLPAS